VIFAICPALPETAPPAENDNRVNVNTRRPVRSGPRPRAAEQVCQ